MSLEIAIQKIQSKPLFDKSKQLSDGKRVLIDDLRIGMWLSEEPGISVECIFGLRFVRSEWSRQIMKLK